MRTYFQFVALIVAILLLATGCRDHMRLDPEVGVDGAMPVRLSFAYTAPESRLRALQNEETEQTIKHLVLYVFDSNGARILRQVYAPGEGGLLSGVKFDNPSALPTTPSIANRGELLDVLLPAGEYTLVLFANSTETAGSVYYLTMDGTTPADASSITVLEDLQELKARIRSTGGEYDATRSSGSLLMVGQQKLTVTAGKASQAEIHLRRIDASVTVKFRSGGNISFVPSEWSVRNIPTVSYMMARPVPVEVGVGDPSAYTEPQSWDAAQDIAKDYTQALSGMPFDFVDTSTDTDLDAEISFYMPENRKLPKALIPYTGSDGFKQRFLHIKNIDRTNSASYKYAPQQATIIQVKGTITYVDRESKSVHADVIYNIPLGDTQASVDNYSIERNTRYTFNITIKGVDDIIVEARRDLDTGFEDSEVNTQVEGDVTRTSGASFILDSHYEQRLWKYTALDMSQKGLFTLKTVSQRLNPKSVTSYEPNEDATFVVRIATPFTSRGSGAAESIRFTLVQLKKWYQAGPETRKTLERQYWPGDWRWVTFAFNKGTMVPYSKTAYVINNRGVVTTPLVSIGPAVTAKTRLLSLPEFLYHLVYERPTSWDGVNATPGRYSENIWQLHDASNTNPGYLDGAVTIFVDEYFYERDPNIESQQSARDNTLWKRFANASPRTFELDIDPSTGTTGTGAYVSWDGKSIYRQPILKLTQHSIKTIFVQDPTASPSNSSSRTVKEFRIWGINNFPKATSKLPHWLIRTKNENRRFFINRLTNGWLNTYRSMGQPVTTDNTFKAKVDYGYYNHLTSNQEATRIENDSLILYTTADRNSYNFQIYTPFIANRDLDGNNDMEPEELKWYVPAIAQLQTYTTFVNALPVSARFNTSPREQRQVLASSTSNYPVANNGDMLLVVAATRTGSMNHMSMGEAFNMPDYESYEDPNIYPGQYLVRDLSYFDTDDSGVSTKNNANYATEFGVSLPMDASYYFSTDHISRDAFRSQAIVGELSPHDQLDLMNNIYVGGFRAARRLATNADGSLYKKTWIELRDDVNAGKSPCSRYSESTNDKGKWRVPNSAELTIMLNEIPQEEWDAQLAEAEGVSTGELPDGFYAIWGRTHLRKSILNTTIIYSWLPTEQGYGIYISKTPSPMSFEKANNKIRMKQYLIGVTGLTSFGAYYPENAISPADKKLKSILDGVLSKSQQGYVRCVRDGK